MNGLAGNGIAHTPTETIKVGSKRARVTDLLRCCWRRKLIDFGAHARNGSILRTRLAPGDRAPACVCLFVLYASARVCVKEIFQKILL